MKFNRNSIPSPWGAIPKSFTKLSTNTLSFPLQKGQLNKAHIYPKIYNEHCESSREIQGVVSSGNHVGQIFRASRDNISQLGITLESAAGSVVDDFEGYATDAELQAIWVASGNLATLETVIVKEGTQSMAIPGNVLFDTWAAGTIVQDYTGYSGNLNAYFTEEFSRFKVSLYIGDGVNTKSFQLIQSGKDRWQKFTISEVAMIEDGGGTTDVSAITQIGFRIDDKGIGDVVYIDRIFSTPPPGEVGIELWDMGTTLPTDGVTSIDDGTQYTQIGSTSVGVSQFDLRLLGGKRLYNMSNFTAGINKNEPSNELLNEGNYYAIVLNYIDTDISVYGPDTSFSTNYYTSGYAFTAPDDATGITAIGQYSDLMFHVFSTQEVYLYEVQWRFDTDPGENAEITVYVEDKDMKITDVIVDVEEDPEIQHTFQFKEAPMQVVDGSKVEWYYSDDHTDAVDELHAHMSFYYEPLGAYL